MLIVEILFTSRQQLINQMVWPGCHRTVISSFRPKLNDCLSTFLPAYLRAFRSLDTAHYCECGLTLSDAGRPAAVEIKQFIVSHARMQSRPSDSREQKVGRRHVSRRGSRGAFVRRQWQKGVEGALLDAIQRQFVSPAVEARPKTREQLEPWRDW